MAMIVPGFNDGYTYDGELYHYGKKGMAWGKRQYQNPDGSLTPLGRVHYGIGAGLQSAKNAGNWLTGNAARNKYDASKSKAKQANEYANTYGHINNNLYRKAQLADAKANAAKQDYEKTLPGQTERLARNVQAGVNSVGRALGSAAKPGLENAAAEAKRRVEVAGNAARSTYDNTKNYVTGGKAKSRYESAKAEAKRQNDIANTYRDIGTSQANSNLQRRAQLADAKANAARQDYEKTLPGQAERLTRNLKTGAENAANEARKRLEAAGNAIGNTASSAYESARSGVDNAANEARKRVEAAGRTVKGAYESARSGAKNVTAEAKKRVENASNNTKNYVTGGKAKSRYESAKAEAKRQNDIANTYRDIGTSQANSNLQRRAQLADAKANAARKEYEKTLPGQIERLGRNISNTASNAYNSASNFAGTQAQNIQTMATNAKENLEQFVETQTENITNFANAIGDKAASTIEDIQQSASKAIDAGKGMIDDAMKGIGSAASSVGSFMSDAASTVASAGSAAFDTGKTFVEEAFKKIKWPF